MVFPAAASLPLGSSMRINAGLKVLACGALILVAATLTSGIELAAGQAEGESQITALGHVALRVRDLNASLKFYTDILGLKEAFRINDENGNPTLVYLAVNDNNWIELFPGGKEPIAVNANVAGIVHLCLLVEDLNAYVGRLKAKGYNVTEQIRKGRTGSLLTFINDPDGNRIELMQILADSMQARSRSREGSKR